MFSFSLFLSIAEEETLLQTQIFDLIKTIQHIQLTEQELALFSATLLVRPGELNLLLSVVCLPSCDLPLQGKQNVLHDLSFNTT